MTLKDHVEELLHLNPLNGQLQITESGLQMAHKGKTCNFIGLYDLLHNRNNFIVKGLSLLLSLLLPESANIFRDLLTRITSRMHPILNVVKPVSILESAVKSSILDLKSKTTFSKKLREIQTRFLEDEKCI